MAKCEALTVSAVKGLTIDCATETEFLSCQNSTAANPKGFCVETLWIQPFLAYSTERRPVKQEPRETTTGKH